MAHASAFFPSTGMNCALNPSRKALGRADRLPVAASFRRSMPSFPFRSRGRCTHAGYGPIGSRRSDAPPDCGWGPASLLSPGWHRNWTEGKEGLAGRRSTIQGRIYLDCECIWGSGKITLELMKTGGSAERTFDGLRSYVILWWSAGNHFVEWRLPEESRNQSLNWVPCTNRWHLDVVWLLLQFRGFWKCTYFEQRRASGNRAANRLLSRGWRMWPCWKRHDQCVERGRLYWAPPMDLPVVLRSLQQHLPRRSTELCHHFRWSIGLGFGWRWNWWCWKPYVPLWVHLCEDSFQPPAALWPLLESGSRQLRYNRPPISERIKRNAREIH